MTTENPGSHAERHKKVLAQLVRDREIREGGYRERALKIFPHVCASCGREFSGKRLKELTVHHRDHNHDNNPPDGSNWELLCVYCHDHEHEKSLIGKYYTGPASREDQPPPLAANPFEKLDSLLKPGKKDSDPPPGR